MHKKRLGLVSNNLQPLGSGRGELKSYHCVFVYICVLVRVYIYSYIHEHVRCTWTHVCIKVICVCVTFYTYIHTFVRINIRRCTDLSWGPARARIEIQERRRIIGHNNEAAIQEPAVVGGVVRPHQERHRFGGAGAAAEALRALAVPALRRGE